MNLKGYSQCKSSSIQREDKTEGRGSVLPEVGKKFSPVVYSLACAAFQIFRARPVILKSKDDISPGNVERLIT